MKSIIHFLVSLNKNNSRDWFQDHKQEYADSRDRFLGIINDIIQEIQKFDMRFEGLTAKDTVFRINRDVRFSKDKSPYKTHFGAYMAPGGRKSIYAGYYFHVGYDEVFIAAGTYQPGKEELHAIRQEIMYQPETYRKLIAGATRMGFTMMEQDKLKTGPKGFDKESPHIELIKPKHYIFMKHLTSREKESSNITSVVSNYFRSLSPYAMFLNTAIDFKGNE